jgi:hypothetical protein
MAKSQGGKGAKKYGRGKRSPSNQAYKATNRRAINKAKKRAKHSARCTGKVLTGMHAHGFARAQRRHPAAA